MGDNPRGIGRTSAGKLLYVANWSSPGSVSLHDAIGLHRADFVL